MLSIKEKWNIKSSHDKNLAVTFSPISPICALLWTAKFALEGQWQKALVGMFEYVLHKGSQRAHLLYLAYLERFSKWQHPNFCTDSSIFPPRGKKTLGKKQRSSRNILLLILNSFSSWCYLLCLFSTGICYWHSVKVTWLIFKSLLMRIQPNTTMKFGQLYRCPFLLSRVFEVKQQYDFIVSSE